MIAMSITMSEALTLLTCDFENDYLTVPKDKERIVKLSCDEVTCKQMFLRALGLSVFDLNDVILRLNECSREDPSLTGKTRVISCDQFIMSDNDKSIICTKIASLYRAIQGKNLTIILRFE
jgi:hypothetical protein